VQSRSSRFLVACTSVALGLLPLGCGKGGEPASADSKGPPPVTVELYTTRPEAIVDTVDLVGQLEAEESVEIRSEIEGLIASVGFEEGSEVRKGAVLFRLRDDEQRARLLEAEANLALTEDVFQRTSQLARQNITAAAQLDRARADRAAARARVEIARVELERTEIRAPFDGVLGVRLVSPGDRVEPTTPLVTLDAVKRLRLSFVIPEIAVPLAEVGRTVQLTTAPFPGETFAGEVFFVAPSLDPATRRLLLKAWVPNPERRLRPGLFANLKLELGERQGALLVPEEAVVYDRQGSFVWRLQDDGTAQRAPVQLGVHAAGRVEVREGLESGDTIVSAGTHKVQPGVVLRTSPPALARPPATSGTTAPVSGGR
jgi:membrane fusion protein (multidrug efflux system)